jgi:hypothetical protein
MTEVDPDSRLTRFHCNTDSDCELLEAPMPNASLGPFPKQEVQSVPDHSRKLELVPTDQLQFIFSPITQRRFSTWLFIQKRLHSIT